MLSVMANCKLATVNCKYKVIGLGLEAAQYSV